MAQEKANWVKVDPSTLPEALRAKFAALEKARSAEREARQNFEMAFVAASEKAKKIPSGKEVVFGYRFGGLAVAVVDKGTTGTAPKGGASWF